MLFWGAIVDRTAAPRYRLIDCPLSECNCAITLYGWGRSRESEIEFSITQSKRYPTTLGEL